MREAASLVRREKMDFSLDNIETTGLVFEKNKVKFSYTVKLLTY